MRRVGLFLCATLLVLNACVFDCFGAYDVVIKAGRVIRGPDWKK